MKKIYLSLFFAAASVVAANAQVATFEDIVIGEEGHMSVSTEDDDDRTEFTSGGYTFATGCFHDSDYWYWFGYANRTKTTFESLDDQWNNIVGGGHNGSANYGIGFSAEFNGPCFVTVAGDEGAVVPGLYVTNSSYAYTSMLNGDSFAKKFGQGDWFKLTITGYDANEEVTGTKEYYLADLREADKAYIINDWRYVDLSGLGKVKKILFVLTSSDTGNWGMNTPGYFCFDDLGAEGTEELPSKNVNFAATFEDITVEGTESFFADKTQVGINPWNSVDYTLDTYYSNSWGSDYFADYVVSNCTATDGTDYTKPYQSTAGGAKNGNNYAVFYADYYNTVDGSIYLAAPSRVSGFWVCNTTYAAYGIKNWDGQSSDQKPFGQDDYFKLIITGYDINGEETGTVEQMLIDCTDAKEWHYINDWRWVDLTSLGNNVMYVKFSFDGTKKNDWGLTTPTYVCIDDFGGDAPAKNTPYEVIEQPTAIDNVAAEKSNNAVRKFFKDGRFVIAKDGKLFNASGAEVK